MCPQVTFLTISNGLGPQIDPVFLTKRGWNTQRSFRLFWTRKRTEQETKTDQKESSVLHAQQFQKGLLDILCFWLNQTIKMRDGLEKWNDLHPGSIRGALWQLWGLPEHPEQQLQGENPPRCQSQSPLPSQSSMNNTTDLTLVVIFSPNYPTAHQGQSLWRPYWPGATSKHFDKSDKLGLAWLLTSY